MSKWIEFEHYPPKLGCKTSMWIIKAKINGDTLGLVKWYPSWRKYAFFPVNTVVFEEVCLRDIALFIEEETKKYKEKK